MIALDIENIRPAEVVAYMKLYYQDGRHWSTPRGLLNLVLVLSTSLGSIMTHKILFGLSGCEDWLVSAVGAFLFMKSSFLLAYMINVTRTEFHVGLCVGLCCVWAVHWLPLSHSCPVDELDDMVTVKHLSSVLALLQALLCALLARHADYISSDSSTYMNLPQSVEDLSFETMHPMQADYGLSATFGTKGVGEPPVRLPPGAAGSHSKKGKPAPM